MVLYKALIPSWGLPGFSYDVGFYYASRPVLAPRHAFDVLETRSRGKDLSLAADMAVSIRCGHHTVKVKWAL